MPSFCVSNEQLRQFEEDGYFLVPDLLDQEELNLLTKIARTDGYLASESINREDAAGGKTLLAVRNELTDDVYSAIARSRRRLLIDRCRNRP